MTHIEGQLPDNHEEFRGALCERRNNRTGARAWAVRFTHSATPLDHQKTLWLTVPDDATWFTDREGPLPAAAAILAAAVRAALEGG